MTRARYNKRWTDIWRKNVMMKLTKVTFLATRKGHLQIVQYLVGKGAIIG